MEDNDWLNCLAEESAVPYNESLRRVLALADEKEAGEEGGDRFEEVLAVMDEELLIRLRHRLRKVGKKGMVRLMDEEIRKREVGER
jgi:hypothetical protein